MRRCHELDEQGLYWFEESIAYDNLGGYAQLASKVRTPLQTGENYYGAGDLLNFLESGGVHYAMGDLMRIGGVTGWMRTVGVAVAAGIQFSNHLYPEFAAHLLRVTPTAHWLEWVDWAHPILTDQADGWDDAVVLAEKLQCAVWAAPEDGRPGSPETHPLFQGALPPAIGPLARSLAGHDVIVVVGAPVFRYYPYVPGEYLPAGAELFHITDDPSEAARAPVSTARNTDLEAVNRRPPV
jgi:enolase-like protein